MGKLSRSEKVLSVTSDDELTLQAISNFTR
jgi:hypothetical protein